MGWYGTHGVTRAGVVREIVDRPSVIARRIVGSTVWTVERTADNKHAFIGCYLLSRHGGCWGYKSIDETMGPYHYTCPLALLEIASEPVNETSRAWRERVRQYHASRTAPKPAIGARYVTTHPILLRAHGTVPAGETVRVTEVRGSRVIVATSRGLVRVSHPLINHGFAPAAE